MGNQFTSTLTYSSEIQAALNSDQTGIRQGRPDQKALVDNLQDNSLRNAWDIFQRGKSRNPSRPCLGYRMISHNSKLKDYAWLSYSQVEQAALSIGTFLSTLIPIQNFPAERYLPARSMQLLGLYSKNCVPWFVCEQVANAYNLTLVPFFSSLKAEAAAYIFKQTKLSVMAGSIEGLKDFVDHPEISQLLEHFIAFDDTVPDDIAEKAKSKNISLHKYSTLLKTPAKPCKPGNLESVSTLCYTSGTTANPKAVILTHGNLVATIAALLDGPLRSDVNNFIINQDDIHFSYLPAAHVFERSISNLVLYKGAQIGVYSGDVTQLLDDVQALKPTVFISVPRLFNRIHDKIFAKIKEKSALAQKIFNVAMATKLKQYRTDGTLTHRFCDNLVFNKIKNMMGGELRYFVVGGAPISAAIQENISVIFSTPMTQGYGLSETCGTSFISHRCDPFIGHVGGPIPSLEFKLESAPDLEYFVDSEHPSGEVLLRGPSVTPGYFMNPEETQENIDADGWLHTGDIAVLLPNGALKILDRKKNIFKLSQGEYVSPELIEAVYQQSPYISQIFVHGDTMKNCLVGIVVIDPDEALKWKNSHQLGHLSLPELCKHAEFIETIQQDLDNVSRKILKGFEKIKALHLTDQPFTEDLGILTPTQKLKRHHAKQYFKDIINSLYATTE